MINPAHLRDNIIVPVLNMMASVDPRLADEKAVNLLLGTAAQESDMGYFMVQEGISNGAKGLYQMEDATHNDIVKRYLARPENENLLQLLHSVATPNANPNHLIGNHYYATFLARIKYWMIPEPLPSGLEGQSVYYKKFFNTESGSATSEQYQESWNRFVEPYL